MINVFSVAGKQGGTVSRDSGAGKAGVFTGPYSPLTQALALLPLVVFYEAAIPFTTLRSGWYHRIDAWSQAALAEIGLTAYYLPGVLILAVLVAIHLWRREAWNARAADLWRLWGESLLWAVPLLVLYLLFTLPVHRFLAAALDIFPRGPTDLFSNLVLAIGAGLFEEFLFRLVLLSLFLFLLQKLFRVPLSAAQIVSVCVVAAVFAAAHHLGPGPWTYNPVAFLFRVAAGIYLGSVFIVRGFATAAIVHATFNVLYAVIAML